MKKRIIGIILILIALGVIVSSRIPIQKVGRVGSVITFYSRPLLDLGVPFEFILAPGLIVILIGIWVIYSSRQQKRPSRKKTKLSKKARKKKGLNYLLIAVIPFVIYLIMYVLGFRGLIPSLISLVFIIFFILGLIYFIGGFVGKD